MQPQIGQRVRYRANATLSALRGKEGTVFDPPVLAHPFWGVRFANGDTDYAHAWELEDADAR